MSEHKVHILHYGERIELSRDWIFTYPNRSGNFKFLKKYITETMGKMSDAKIKKFYRKNITLEKGTILKVAKIDSYDIYFEIVNTRFKDHFIRMSHKYENKEDINDIYFITDDDDSLDDSTFDNSENDCSNNSDDDSNNNGDTNDNNDFDNGDLNLSDNNDDN
jgi:hypothetical protein